MQEEKAKDVFFIDPTSESCSQQLVGGKARNLWLLGRMASCLVPPWFCITTEAFDLFVQEHALRDFLHVDPAQLKTSTAEVCSRIMTAPIPTALRAEIESRLTVPPFSNAFVAVRSSGTDEDSAAHSFAGQFETFLFQRGLGAVTEAVKKCWCSCFSERVMSHRLECGMPTTGVRMAVVVQVMVNSEVSGVGFSRHPLKPLSSDVALVEAVYGLGEGLVSGELEADRYEVSRSSFDAEVEILEKPEMFVQDESGGVKKVPVPEGMVKAASLSEEQASAIGQLLVKLEKSLGRPQDFEWAIENGQLYCLQTRPVVTLPPSYFFDLSVPGGTAILWDNSNIVESYSGVTSPLTFSFASRAYEQVYTITLLAAGVPAFVVAELKPHLSNMLGLVRGNIYYNLTSWYRCLVTLPIGDTSKYMETMMGVKQSLDPELEARIGSIQDSAPKYGIWTKLKVIAHMVRTIYTIDRHVEDFIRHFMKHYADALATDFNSMPLTAQVSYVKMLFKEVLGRWEVPIYNDTYVMVFFGLLKTLVSKWLTDDPNKAQSLQNDLLCGQGDVESTEPTKAMMRIAEYVDSNEHEGELRRWFLECRGEVLEMLAEEVGRVASLKNKKGMRVESSPTHASGLRQRKKVQFSEELETPPPVLDLLHQAKRNTIQSIQRFLSKYGFRCINELKLEENTLHDDPGFIIDTISGYIRTGSYSIRSMEQRELEIRGKAEQVVASTLSWPKRTVFNWVLFHTRRSVKHRENLRFDRTKLFGVFRSLFRAIGSNLVSLGLLQHRQDIFYLTVEEIFAFVDGRAVTNDLAGLVELRRKEYDGYRKGISPPERFMTRGAVGPYLPFPTLLEDLDLLKEHELEASSDPNVLTGTPCCPGVVEGIVRVVTSIQQTEGLNGEILVTARTDPGWVPLYPLCSGLVIERGSLLSHSAVVARELGLPTIVGVSGGLMKRLKSGMRVHVDAGRGRLTILREEEEEEEEGEREMREGEGEGQKDRETREGEEEGQEDRKTKEGEEETREREGQEDREGEGEGQEDREGVEESRETREEGKEDEGGRGEGEAGGGGGLVEDS